MFAQAGLDVFVLQRAIFDIIIGYESWTLALQEVFHFHQKRGFSKQEKALAGKRLIALNRSAYLIFKMIPEVHAARSDCVLSKEMHCVRMSLSIEHLP